jgi:hypothetical protein
MMEMKKNIITSISFLPLIFMVPAFAISTGKKDNDGNLNGY